MKFKLVAIFLVSCLLPHISFSHLGSPNIVLQGTAGEYPVLVNIMPPEVVPGLAQISVRVNAEQIAGVSIQGIYFRTGSEGAPEPEALTQVPGDEQLFSGKIWLMERGSASVKVIVDGWQGEGSTVVPIPSIAIREPIMDKGLGTVLTILGLILFFGAVTLVYASVGEASVSLGEKLPRRKKFLAIGIGAVSLALLLGVLNFGKNWWEGDESQYRFKMFESTPMQTMAEGRELTIQLSSEYAYNQGTDGKRWYKRAADPYYDRSPTQLLPDHGKLMHAFLVEKTSGQHFAHIHPIRKDSITYEVALDGQMPNGAYHFFADIVHQSGIIETLYDEVTLNAYNLKKPKELPPCQ